MEEGAPAADSDSDETVIEGSVIESDMEGEEIHWKRLLFDQDTSLRPEFSFHPGTNVTWKGIPSPEIKLGLTLRKDSQEQKNKSEVIPILNEDTVLQELSEDSNSPEVSLLSGAALIGSGIDSVQEQSLAELEKISAVPETTSEPEKEVTLTPTFKEAKDEESSLETFVSALEKLLVPKSSQEETLIEIMDDFDLGESMNLLSNSPGVVSVPLSALAESCGDLPGSTQDDKALSAELLAATDTLPEAQVEPMWEAKEQSQAPSGGNECLEVQPGMLQTDEDLTQIAQTLEDPFVQVLAHENIISYEPLNKEGTSNPMKNTSVFKTPCVPRRSSRLQKRKASRDVEHTDDMCMMTEMILPETLSCEDQITKSSAKNFRTQDSALMTEGKGKNMCSSRFNSEKIRKREQIIMKNAQMRRNKLCSSSINRRNIFGENFLYVAALRDDVELVRRCIKNGGNVNQPSYAGWTALHEVSVAGYYQTASELLKGGADVNIKGMYQITPLHDAVINGHQKVVELLLSYGADPLLRNADGKCALDEAKDSYMKNLLEKYVPRHKNYLSARRKIMDPAHEDVSQFKKPRSSSINHTCFDENSKRLNPHHVHINKESKGLFINENGIYEHYQENSNTKTFGRFKNKQSTVNQLCSPGLKKGYVNNFRDRRTDVSKSKGKRNVKKHRKFQVDDEDCSLRQTTISSSRRMDTLDTHQHCSLQSVGDFPKGSFELSTTTLSSLKNGVDNKSEACSVSRELHTQAPESSDQTGGVSLSGFALHKEIMLPLVTAHQQPHPFQEQGNIPDKSLEKSNLDETGKISNNWEDSFISFIKKHVDNDDTKGSTSKKTVTSTTEVYSTEGESHCDYQENITHREETDSQVSLPSEDHLSQKNELKEGSLTTLPQEEVVNFCDSDNIVISEQHVESYEQCIHETSFARSHGSPEQTSLPCSRTPPTCEVSKMTSHVELLNKPQDNDLREPTPSVNQTDAHNVEKKQDPERNYPVTDQKPSSSNSPPAHSQKLGITRVEKMKHDLPEHSFLSTDNINREFTNISQLDEREDKETSHKSDEELTSSANEEERTIQNCEKKKEKMDSEIHMPPKTQDHNKVKVPALRPKRYQQCACDGDKTVILPSLSHQTPKKENLSVHQTINGILQHIEEKQEHLLAFEIRSPEDAEQYIERMLEVKEVMDNVLAQQKAERDDLAKKYRVSVESFKHGALREQLTNLATRQKHLLAVAKKQKKIRLKIQNYNSVTPFSSLSLRKSLSSSHMSGKKNSQELNSLEKSVPPQSGSLSPTSLAYGSMKETPLSLETWSDSQNTSICLNEETMRREEFPGNKMNSKQNVNGSTLDERLKPRCSEGAEKTGVSSQPAEYLQEENGLTETTATGPGLPAAVDTLQFSEGTNILSQNDACPSTVTWNQDLLRCVPKRRNRRRDSQHPPEEVPESLAHQGIAILGSDTVHQTDLQLRKTASAVSHASNIRVSSSSGSDHPHTIKKTVPYTIAPKKKTVQLKDLISLGRINPGNNILEFKTKETTHKASILLSGKLRVENGQIYQNPVTWLKDLLGKDSYVTWNYAWSKVTYLGKELLKYVSEEAPLPPEPNATPQKQEPCLPGTSLKSVQSIPHYLQIKEILSISNQELLPHHVMDQHWKFYVECAELAF